MIGNKYIPFDITKRIEKAKIDSIIEWKIYDEVDFNNMIIKLDTILLVRLFDKIDTISKLEISFDTNYNLGYFIGIYHKDYGFLIEKYAHHKILLRKKITYRDGKKLGLDFTEVIPSLLNNEILFPPLPPPPPPPPPRD